jgi:hypothetical protein
VNPVLRWIVSCTLLLIGLSLLGWCGYLVLLEMGNPGEAGKDFHRFLIFLGGLSVVALRLAFKMRDDGGGDSRTKTDNSN